MAQRETVIQVRVSFAEKEQIKQRAEKASVPVSEFMRAKALGFSPSNPERAVPAEEVRGILNPEPKAAAPTEATPPPSAEPTSEEVEALARQIFYAEGKTMMVARREARKQLEGG